MDNSNIIWIVGTVIIANIWLAVDNVVLFGVWMIYAIIIMIVETIRVNNEIKRQMKEIRLLEQIKKDIEKRIKKK